ncbi:MAG: polysaccharide biosynthesis tyrosine autokinase [Deltaproteobacteria bacterium]|nr:polysaccharide biosynthesis tyrosine autokinase [Deltaproteobacteria bacterium]
MAEGTEIRDLKADNAPYNGFSRQEDIHLREYLHIIQKHKWTVMAVFVVVVTTTVIGTFSMSPVYTAATTLKIEKEPPKVLKFEYLLPIEAGAGAAADYYQTQKNIIQSRNIAKRVIEKLSLWNHPQFKGEGLVGEARADVVAADVETMEKLIDSFLGFLDMQMVRNSHVARISYSSRYPELSAEVSNAIAQTYIDFNLESNFKAAEKARDWLSGRLQEFQGKVERSEEALNSFAGSHGIFSLEKDENIVLKRLEQLNEALSAAEADRIGKESHYKEITRRPLEAIPSATENDLINNLKERLSELEAEYFNLSGQYKPDYPKMVRLKAQIGAVEKKIEGEMENLVKEAEVAYRIGVGKEKLLRDAFEEQKQLALKIKERAIQYNILKREVDTNKELYDGLLQRVKETGVSAGLETSNIQVIDVAEVPLSSSKPRKKLNISLSMLIGLFMGGGLAFFLEYFDDTVKDPDEMAKLFNLPALGLIPAIQSIFHRGKRDADKNKEPQPSIDDLYLVSQKYPRSSISEACRTFRTSLLFSRPGHPPKTILVTSNNPREGKTVVSCNLGIVLAQSGAKTLIIDADLRRPTINRVFSIPDTPGLTDCLTGHATLKDAVRPVGINGLFVLPAGPISPNPPELLDSTQFKEAIEELKREFDFIVFDSAPVMHFADTLNLANKVDCTVIVVHSGKTTKNDLRHCVGLIRGVKASVLGVVMNILDVRKSGYYYHYYGEGYGKSDQAAVSKGGEL